MTLNEAQQTVEKVGGDNCFAKSLVAETRKFLCKLVSQTLAFLELFLDVALKDACNREKPVISLKASGYTDEGTPCVRRAAENDYMGTPVLVLDRSPAEQIQHSADYCQIKSASHVAPARIQSLLLKMAVNPEDDEPGHYAPDIADKEHRKYTAKEACKSDAPVEITKLGAEAWIVGDYLGEGGQIDCSVRYQEEHRDNRGNNVEVAEYNAHQSNNSGYH